MAKEPTAAHRLPAYILEAGRYDAFMSYARTDREVAEKLRAGLEALGKDVWVDVEDIPGGAEWRMRIKRGIEACKAFLFLLSPASLRSDSCRDELEFAVALKKLIIPVYFCEVEREDMPVALADREWGLPT